MWLEPLPDKSLPSLNIQKAMFPLLDRMYIDSTSLKMSGLGKLVLFYTRCDRVDKGIARIADRLIGESSIPDEIMPVSNTHYIPIVCRILVETYPEEILFVQRSTTSSQRVPDGPD
jgi:hypothetical protein